MFLKLVLHICGKCYASLMKSMKMVNLVFFVSRIFLDSSLNLIICSKFEIAIEIKVFEFSS